MSRLTRLESARSDSVRRDLSDRAWRETDVGHLDGRERAEVLRDIDVEIQRLEWLRREAHERLGLVDRALDKGSLSTLVLHAVLATLRATKRQP